MNDWRSVYQDKIVSADQAVENIKTGHRVVIGHACGEPPALIEALVNRAPEVNNVEIVHMVAMGPAKYAQPELEKSFRHNGLFIGAPTRKALEEKRADYTPCFFSEIPRLFKDNSLPVDVALIQLTPPDEQGFCSFGISVDYTQAAAECAQLVIAQMNNNMPRTGGSKIHLDELDFIVEKDEPLIELKPPKIGEVEKAIGENVATLVQDGATLQLGIGAIPDAVLLFLNDKKDLGIHSEMFSDGVVALAEAGVITNKKKSINPGKFIATFLMGTRKLYDFVDNNPDVVILPVNYVNDPYVIGQHENMVSINSAIQVDLMGQVNAEMIGSRQFSAVGGQVDFVRGASRSLKGISIIALPATASGGKISRITCDLDRGAAVTTSRNDVQYVVTEYGIVNLRGKCLRERAEALISISHPDFRTGLINDAKEKGIL
ncbi:acetyl-CoA hydrolase/transferase family protein [Desulfosporosinus sp. BICA1-9]|uniref:acetyl-CoA hydrolase/transferase family protein n=1 Tax=Desulfosporosinus sp. BICA1-9 TaxID=1531958 RepID=UPI00054C04C5|nr:acetyl-CoA hydrolase/transferase C-terminal domain-containing protein [Desulfosporosinus sp. BICA1-9]KJS46673.1 MAG: 4-hydroxybutyrate CoA-transferase [Peptococcaceae bacterium BRH_c23]KJS79594.1 MAG: 4-hydroxybutyrate CoA-transferase [Desulfosporosinus sp. BICA1-9]HBW36247.1 4-hydroxybutyrate CoA-transferase [Desulfosporosinus sp.]